MPWLADVEGVLEVWYAGQKMGPAIASLLWGDVNPMDSLARQVAASGIKHVHGDVVADASAFDNRLVPEGWQTRYLGAAYAAGLAVGFPVWVQRAADFAGYLRVGDVVLHGAHLYLDAPPGINTWPPFFGLLCVPLSLLARASTANEVFDGLSSRFNQLNDIDALMRELAPVREDARAARVLLAQLRTELAQMPPYDVEGAPPQYAARRDRRSVRTPHRTCARGPSARRRAACRSREP